jgi:hypothetical protein
MQQKLREEPKLPAQAARQDLGNATDVSMTSADLSKRHAVQRRQRSGKASGVAAVKATDRTISTRHGYYLVFVLFLQRVRVES